jgi:hypothetical protein
LSDFLRKLEFSRAYFRKILKYKISWKSVQLEPSCSMRTDRRTNVTNVTVAFRNIANAPNTRTLNTRLFSYSQVCLNKVTWVVGKVHQAENPIKKLRTFHFNKRGFDILQIAKYLKTTITGVAAGLWYAQDKKTDALGLTAELRSDDEVVGRKCIVNTCQLPTSTIRHSTSF